MESIQELLRSLFEEAIASAFPDLTDAPVVITVSANNPKFGDYQCNSAMPIANAYKQLGKKVAPREIAEKILQNLKVHDIVERTEIAGPGFINVYLSKVITYSLRAWVKNGL